MGKNWGFFCVYLGMARKFCFGFVLSLFLSCSVSGSWCYHPCAHLSFFPNHFLVPSYYWQNNYRYMSACVLWNVCSAEICWRWLNPCWSSRGITDKAVYPYSSGIHRSIASLLAVSRVVFLWVSNNYKSDTFLIQLNSSQVRWLL